MVNTEDLKKYTKIIGKAILKESATSHPEHVDSAKAHEHALKSVKHKQLCNKHGGKITHQQGKYFHQHPKINNGKRYELEETLGGAVVGGVLGSMVGEPLLGAGLGSMAGDAIDSYASSAGQDKD